MNRIDYAVDILAPGFELDIEQFVAPARAKVQRYWSKDLHLDDAGNVPQPVVRGRRFESVTVGKMPNRQIIAYDKRRAAIDLKQPYWFDAWGVERSDPTQQVWRVELRAGRDALARKLLRRRFDAVEACLRDFLITAVNEVRYLAGPPTGTNVSREPDHPLWTSTRRHIEAMPLLPAPTLPEEHVLALIRQQRREMAVNQAFGNLINALLLEGHSFEAVFDSFPQHASTAAAQYAEAAGRRTLAEKVRKASGRLGALFGTAG